MKKPKPTRSRRSQPKIELGYEATVQTRGTVNLTQTELEWIIAEAEEAGTGVQSVGDFILEHMMNDDFFKAKPEDISLGPVGYMKPFQCVGAGELNTNNCREKVAYLVDGTRTMCSQHMEEATAKEELLVKKHPAAEMETLDLNAGMDTLKIPDENADS